MSYDIYLTHKDTPSSEIGNMTCNVAPMYNKAFNEESWSKYLNGKKGRECQSRLIEAIGRMKLQPEEYKKLEPDNGWGSYKGALEFLNEILSACEEFPEMTISIT